MPPKKRNFTQVAGSGNPSNEHPTQPAHGYQESTQDHGLQMNDSSATGLIDPETGKHMYRPGKRPRLFSDVLEVDPSKPMDPREELWIDRANWDIPNLNSSVEEVIDTFIRDTDSDNYQKTGFFRDFIKLPSRKFYANYFQKIEKPISMKEIKNRDYQVINSTPSNYEKLLLDLELLYKNCRAYNHEDTLIVKSGQQCVYYLKHEFSKLKNVKRNYLLNGGVLELITERIIKPIEISTEVTISEKLKKVYDDEDWSTLEGRPLDDETSMIEPFLELVDKDEYPDYYQAIYTPLSFQMIKGNLAQGFYKTVYDFFIDLQLLFQNCLVFNHEETEIHKDGQKLLDYTKVLFYELMDYLHTRPSGIVLDIDKLAYEKYLFNSSKAAASSSKVITSFAGSINSSVGGANMNKKGSPNATTGNFTGDNDFNASVNGAGSIIKTSLTNVSSTNSNSLANSGVVTTNPGVSAMGNVSVTNYSGNGIFPTRNTNKLFSLEAFSSSNPMSIRDQAMLSNDEFRNVEGSATFEFDYNQEHLGAKNSYPFGSTFSEVIDKSKFIWKNILQKQDSGANTSLGHNEHVGVNFIDYIKISTSKDSNAAPSALNSFGQNKKDQMLSFNEIIIKNDQQTKNGLNSPHRSKNLSIPARKQIINIEVNFLLSLNKKQTDETEQRGNGNEADAAYQLTGGKEAADEKESLYKTYKTSINLNGTSIGNAMESAPFEFFETVLEDAATNKTSEPSSGTSTEENTQGKEQNEVYKSTENGMQTLEEKDISNGEALNRETTTALPIKSTVPKYKLNPLSYNFKLPEGLHKLNISVSSSTPSDSSSTDTDSICLWLNVL